MLSSPCISIRCMHAQPNFFSVHEFDVHGPVSDKATDAGAYDQDSQLVPYPSGPAGEISTLTNMRRLNGNTLSPDVRREPVHVDLMD